MQITVTKIFWWIPKIKLCKLLNQDYKMWWGKNVWSYRMHLKLSYQLKIDCYKHMLFYSSLIVTANQKPVIVTQRQKERESKYTTTENH